MWLAWLTYKLSLKRRVLDKLPESCVVADLCPLSVIASERLGDLRQGLCHCSPYLAKGDTRRTVGASVRLRCWPQHNFRVRSAQGQHHAFARHLRGGADRPPAYLSPGGFAGSGFSGSCSGSSGSFSGSFFFFSFSSSSSSSGNSGSPGSGRILGVSSFSKSGMGSGLRLGWGVIHSCGQRNALAVGPQPSKSDAPRCNVFERTSARYACPHLFAWLGMQVTEMQSACS